MRSLICSDSHTRTGYIGGLLPAIRTKAHVRIDFASRSNSSLGAAPNYLKYNEAQRSMETVTVEPISIIVGREEDGRWWADIESMPGVMAYGATRESAITAVRALALRAAADCLDHGEEVPAPFAKVFSEA